MLKRAAGAGTLHRSDTQLREAGRGEMSSLLVLMSHLLSMTQRLSGTSGVHVTTAGQARSHVTHGLRDSQPAGLTQHRTGHHSA